MRPPDIVWLVTQLLRAEEHDVRTFAGLVLHATGRLTAEEATFVPETERPKVFLIARIWLAIYARRDRALRRAAFDAAGYVCRLCRRIYGAWFMLFAGFTQHAGLAEDVLDHRLNARTVYMNPLFRFLYWNMNYHVEHHMFPMVPYHALPGLHEAIKADMPAALRRAPSRPIAKSSRRLSRQLQGPGRIS